MEQHEPQTFGRIEQPLGTASTPTTHIRTPLARLLCRRIGLQRSKTKLHRITLHHEVSINAAYRAMSMLQFPMCVISESN